MTRLQAHGRLPSQGEVNLTILRRGGPLPYSAAEPWPQLPRERLVPCRIFARNGYHLPACLRGSSGGCGAGRDDCIAPPPTLGLNTRCPVPLQVEFTECANAMDVPIGEAA